MDVPRRHKVEKFIKEHPFCIYCGGVTPTFDRDHQPPKSIFDQHKWPDGYLFPSCQLCNNGSSDDDYLLSVLMKTCLEFIGINIPEKDLNTIFDNLSKKRPDVFKKIKLMTTNQKRRKLKELGITLARGETYFSIPMLTIPSEFDVAITRGGQKLIKALHYKNSGLIVPKNAALKVRWTTNADWLQGKYILEKEQLKELYEENTLYRENVDLTPQFNYSYLMTPDYKNSIWSCRFGAAFQIVGLISFENVFADKLQS